MNPPAKPRGFTLIELMVALAVLALLLLLGMPSFTAFLRNSEVRSTAESILTGLRTANSEAVNRNRPVAFTLKGGSAWTGWEITFVDEDDTPQTIQQYFKQEAGASTKLTVTPAGETSVTFTGLGRVAIDPADPDDHVRQIEIDTIVTGEARPLRIIVDDPAPPDPSRPRGLRLCDPDPALAALIPPDPRAC